MKHRKKTDKIQAAYVGVVFNKSRFFIAVKCSEKFKQFSVEYAASKPEKALWGWLVKYGDDQKLKIIAIGLAGLDKGDNFAAKLWLKLDAVAHFFAKSEGASIGAARRICQKTADCYDGENRVKIKAGRNRRVKAAFLTDLAAYKKYATPEEFRRLVDLSDDFRRKKLKMIFINATAAGGGIAIMRHAMMRLYDKLNVDIGWHVLLPDAEIFNITKKKFHNILQGVAAPDIVLDDADQRAYLKWTEKCRCPQSGIGQGRGGRDRRSPAGRLDRPHQTPESRGEDNLPLAYPLGCLAPDGRP